MAKKIKHLVGLDIDPAGITAAQVAVDGDLRVDLAAYAPLEPGIVRDGEVHDVEGLSAALQGLFQEHRGLKKRVRMGLANQKIVVRVLELPPLDDDGQLDTAVRFLAQEQLPMPLDQAVFDYQLLDRVATEAGERQRVLIVAARREVAERMLAAARGAGLRPEGLDLAAFAMVRALYRPGADEDHVLYLGIGGLTNLAVAQGRTCVFARTSGRGIEALAIDLSERRQLPLVDARAWLRDVGLETPLEEIDRDPALVADVRRILTEGVRRIAADIRNSLDYHHAQGADGAVARAVVTGPALAIPGFVDALALELKLDVEEGVVVGVPEGIAPGALTVAAGLAIEEIAA